MPAMSSGAENLSPSLAMRSESGFADSMGTLNPRLKCRWGHSGLLNWYLEGVIANICESGCFAASTLPLAGKDSHSRAPLFWYIVPK